MAGVVLSVAAGAALGTGACYVIQCGPFAPPTTTIDTTNLPAPLEEPQPAPPGTINDNRRKKVEPILFGQVRIGPNFSPSGPLQGASVYQVAKDLRDGVVQPFDEFPVIPVFRAGRVLVTESNRGFAALAAAQRWTLVCLTDEETGLFDPSDCDPQEVFEYDPAPRGSVLARLLEAPVVPQCPVPGPCTAVTPGQNDRTTILDVIDRTQGSKNDPQLNLPFP